MPVLKRKRSTKSAFKPKFKMARTSVRAVVPKYKKPKLNALTTYRYSRFGGSGTTITCTDASNGGYVQFSLDDVKNYSDFTNLYDQFMISHCKVYVTLITNPNAQMITNVTGGQNVNAATSYLNPSNWFPKFWYVFDADDNTSPTLDQIRERQGVKYKTLLPNKPICINVKPRALVQTYRTATSTGYAPKRMFLDVDTGYNVPHYAIKYVIDAMGKNPNDTYPFEVRFELKYWLKFKGVK